MRRLICTAGGSNKFWEGRVEGERLIVRFGRTGSDGQTRTKTFPTAAAAEKELEKVAGEKLRAGYLEDAPASPKASDDEQALYPFLFYGARPNDWFEGANQGHLFEARFQTPPDAATAARLAARFQSEVGHGPVEGEALGWSGSFALFALGERFRVRGYALCDRFQAIFRALHAVHPLDQVIFYGAREEGSETSDPWSAWSVARRPKPHPGPPSSYEAGCYPRATDRKLARYAPWPVFDEARQAKADSAARARLEKALRALDGPVRFSFSNATLPEAAPSPALEQLREHEDDRLVEGPGGRIAIVRIPESGPRPLLFVDPGRRPRKTEVSWASGPSFDADGDSVFAVAGEQLLRVDWKTGRSTVIFSVPSGQEIYAARLVPDGLVVATDKELVLLDPRAPERGPLDSHRAVGYLLGSVLGGRVIWAEALMSETLAFVAVAPGALKRLATLPCKGWVEEHEGRVFVHADELLLEAQGLAEAAEACVGGAVRKAEAKKTRPAAAARPSLEPIAQGEVLPPQEVSKEVRAKFPNSAEWVVTTDAGRVIAGLGWGKPFAWLDDKGTRRTLELEETRFAGADAHVDGTIVRGGTFGVYLHDANDGKPSRFLELTGLGNRVMDAGFLGDDVAILAEKGFFIHDRHTGKLLAQAKVARGRNFHVFGGRRVVILTEAKDRIQVLEVLPGPKLKAIFKSPVVWVMAYAVAGRYFLRDASDHWFELRGLS